MTNDSSATPAPSDLPKFSVNVVPTDKIQASHLSRLLERYRQGEIEPLVFGDGNKPEAAVIPFSAFMRLVKRDHADENSAQAELSRRIQESDASGHPGTDLDDLGDELGEPARSMLRRAIVDDD